MMNCGIRRSKFLLGPATLSRLLDWILDMGEEVRYHWVMHRVGSAVANGISN